MLKSTRTFPPGGWQYLQPETGWKARPGATFDEVVRELAAHRAANPRFNLSTDLDEIATELNHYTCLRIAYNPEYCAPDEFGAYRGPEKKLPRPSFWRNPAAGAKESVAVVKKVFAGVGVLLDWLGEGATPVAPNVAEGRARICSDCPQNAQTDLASFFTVPASKLITRQIEIRNEMKLATAWDAKLGICLACACPLRLKTWTPLEHITAKLLPESRSKLDPRCWITSEEKAHATLDQKTV